MTFKFLGCTLTLALMCSAGNALAANKVYDETSLQNAIISANMDTRIKHIVFARDAKIFLTAPVVYNGQQALTLIGNNAIVDGAAAGSFKLNDDLSAQTEDGSLVFNTTADLTIRQLTVANSATRGIVVNIPANAEGDDIEINLYKVNIMNSALYGLHIDDNADAFDDGNNGSDIGIELNIMQSSFSGNGTGAIDFDGVRVDERSQGSINAVIMHTQIDSNGGDGIELDEAGEGDVDATMIHVSLNNNGFYNEDDLDDGFDIDEADDGNIEVKLSNVTVKDNMDEGLDFDEAGAGHVELSLSRVYAMNNSDEGIKVDEEDAGNITAILKKVSVVNNGDDGIQFTEQGNGYVEADLKKIIAENNKKYGIKIQQWLVEDEVASVEAPGTMTIKKVSLSGNGQGNDINTNNIIIETR